MFQRRILIILLLPLFVSFCGIGKFTSNAWRKISRTLFPKDCRVEVTLDTTDLKYIDDLWNYHFQVSEKTEIKEFVSAVRFIPEAKYYQELTDEYSWSSEKFSLDNWGLLSNREYEVRVSKFFSENDCIYSKEQSFKIPALPRKPGFYLNRENIFESDLNKILPISVSNIKEFKIRYAEIDPQVLVQAVSHLGNRYYEFENGIGWKNKTWIPGQKINANSDQGMDLDSYFGKPKQKSWLALEIGANIIGSENKETFKKEKIFLQSTNLGITAKTDREKVYVWAHTLSKASPVDKVSVKLYEKGNAKGSCETDAEGYCALSYSGEKLDTNKSVLIAEQSDGDKAFLYLGETKSDYYSYYSDHSTYQGKLFFDRKLYRPGDRVEFKAFLGEKKKGSFLPYSGKSATILIRDSKGKELLSQSVITSSQGGANGSYTISSDSPLGHYSVSVLVGGESYAIASDSFQVEEFRPVNFMVNVNLKNSIAKNESIKGDVEGKYLFGAPMANAKMKFSLLKKNRYIHFPEYSEYDFGERWYYNDYSDDYSEDSSGYITGEESSLDEKGKYQLDIPVKDLATQFSTEGEDIEIVKPYNLAVEASVFDVDGKSVTKTESVQYFPSDFLVGVKCSDRYQGMEKNFKFEFVTLSNDGKPLSGKDIKAYIIYNDWTSVLSQGIGKYLFRSNQLKKKIVDTKKLTTTSGKVAFDYKVKDSGSYTLIVTNKDGAYSRMDFYAYEKESHYTWDFRGDDSIELKSDKQEYAIGDKAKILIKSPFANARAVVTVERDQLYFTKTYQMKGNSLPLEIPISSEYLPNVEVKVMLITGRQSLPDDASEEDKKEFNEQDLGAPKSKTGSIVLKVDTSGKISPLVVKTDREEYGPRDKVTISIKTAPYSELAISVADRGVLDLVGYRFINPVSAFYRLWRNIVETFELRGMIIKHYAYQNKGDSPGGDYGNEGGGGFGFDSESGIRKDFRYTAYWNPTVTTDSDGEAEVSFALPDNLTTFRVMVASSNNGSYAVENKEFRVKKSLVLQKTASRFLRLGDELEVGVSITNNTKKNGKFKILISSEFLVSPAKEEILDLAAGQTKEYNKKFKLTQEQYLKMRSKNTSENLSATYEVHAEPQSYSDFSDLKKTDISDSLKVVIPIKELEPVTIARTSGYTDSTSKYSIKFPNQESILANRGYLKVNLSATALTGIRNAFDFYASNPYFCMEQRTSAYLLSVSAGELLKEFKYSPPSHESYDFNNIEKLFLDEMSEFQFSDGSFGLWKEKYGRSGYPFLTAYVVQTMQIGKEKGYRYNPKAYSEAIRYLENYLKNPTESKDESWQTLSLIYSVLSKDKKDVAGLQKSLFDNFSELNPKSQAIFLLAYAESKNLTNVSSDSELKKRYDQFLKNFVWEKDSIKIISDQSGKYWYSYYSKASVFAGLLRLMVRLDSQNKKIPELVQNILLEKTLSYWDESHGSGNLALALREYRNTYEVGQSDTSASVFFGERNLIDQSFSGSASSILQEEYSLDRLFEKKPPSSTELSFQRTSSEGRLYYSSSFNYIPAKDERKAVSNGINVEKKIYRVEGRDSNGDPILKDSNSLLQRGGTYMVKIIVESEENRPFLMVVDPIPSNSEIVNTSFLTEGKSNEEGYEESNEDGNEEDYHISYGGYQEFRDDKVLFSRDYLSKGKTEFHYFLRPLVKGLALSPAAKAFLMYHPNIYANTATTKIKVE
ncbi:UPF0192 protein [Leptospira kobayashii]|uniref:UPF0192 protein n=1 Tax=Leptospira kobayashii TaxID=1917830 RepID=A0ABM7UIA4_9LEPT|nr:MG2 domain-containing protein [Leptospira kobayashii]BDA78373.1 UPF0192 protein [Leptospira kobayashii]